MTIRIVHIDSECGPWGDVDHVALNDEVTYCGKPWQTVTRRQGLRDTSERTPCYHCQAKIRERVKLSLAAARDLVRDCLPDDSWERIKYAARVT
jgi:hypothetical protein